LTNFVSQAFCSAISLGYSPESPEAWEPLATLVLEGAYEAALLAAVADRVEREGTGIVWLTKLGGGAFDNKLAWIVGEWPMGSDVSRTVHSTSGSRTTWN
jgi:hypothetical protein